MNARFMKELSADASEQQKRVQSLEEEVSRLRSVLASRS